MKVATKDPISVWQYGNASFHDRNIMAMTVEM